MTSRYADLPPDVFAKEARRRTTAGTEAEKIYSAYFVDDQRHLLGLWICENCW
jgi:Mg/Co/Ni transporter MgtE